VSWGYEISPTPNTDSKPAESPSVYEKKLANTVLMTLCNNYKALVLFAWYVLTHVIICMYTPLCV